MNTGITLNLVQNFCSPKEELTSSAKFFKFENFVNHISDVMLDFYKTAELPNLEKAMALIKVSI